MLLNFTILGMRNPCNTSLCFKEPNTFLKKKLGFLRFMHVFSEREILPFLPRLVFIAFKINSWATLTISQRFLLITIASAVLVSQIQDAGFYVSPMRTG